uniref:Peptide transporter PTR2 n=2 Tax=Aegilops tauschii subsp. strangulata TaxID=200361 RepID=A0A453SN59_AEGTS
MVISFSTFVVGMILTALSAYLLLLVKNGISNVVAVQESIMFLGLYIIAVGVRGLRPCLMSFGADQFDDGDPLERRAKAAFFNWYVFTMYCGSTIASTGIVWVQDHYGWALGPTILAVGLSCLVATSRKYRFQPTHGSPLTGVCQVVVAAVNNFNVELPSDSSLLYELPDDNPVMRGFERIEHTTDLRHCRAVEQGDGGDRRAGVAQSVETLRRDAGGGAQNPREDAAALGHHRVLLRRGGTGPVNFRGAGHGDGHRRRLGAHPARVHVHLQRAHHRRPDPAL